MQKFFREKKVMDFRAFRPKFLGSKSVPIGPVFFTTFLTPPGGGIDPPEGGVPLAFAKAAAALASAIGPPQKKGGLGGYFLSIWTPPRGGHFYRFRTPPRGGPKHHNLKIPKKSARECAERLPRTPINIRLWGPSFSFTVF